MLAPQSGDVGIFSIVLATAKWTTVCTDIIQGHLWLKYSYIFSVPTCFILLLDAELISSYSNANFLGCDPVYKLIISNINMSSKYGNIYMHLLIP